MIKEEDLIFSYPFKFHEVSIMFALSVLEGVAWSRSCHWCGTLRVAHLRANIVGRGMCLPFLHVLEGVAWTLVIDAAPLNETPMCQHHRKRNVTVAYWTDMFALSVLEGVAWRLVINWCSTFRSTYVPTYVGRGMLHIARICIIDVGSFKWSA